MSALTMIRSSTRLSASARFHEDFSNPHIQGSRAPTWPILIKPFHLYRDFTTGPPTTLPDDTGGLGPGGREIVDEGRRRNHAHIVAAAGRLDQRVDILTNR